VTILDGYEYSFQHSVYLLVSACSSCWEARNGIPEVVFGLERAQFLGTGSL
jgi:hypothetical protein